MERRRLFKEVQAAGYPGSYSQVKRDVRQVRPQPRVVGYRPIGGRGDKATAAVPAQLHAPARHHAIPVRMEA